MFAWLTKWFGARPAAVHTHAGAAKHLGKGPQKAVNGAVSRSERANTLASAGSVVRGAQAPAHRAGPAQQPTTPTRKAEESYIETLVRELGDVPALTQHEEQRTSQLVEAMAGYLKTHDIDPPVMPALASRMLELLRAEDVDVVALSRLIEKDQATSAKLLSIANSALYKGTSEVSTVRDAVVFLGTEQVAQIAIGLASRAMFDSPIKKPHAIGGARWGRLFNHAMTTAFAACHLASQRSRKHSEAAFIGGLFHDVGKTVALRALGDVVAERGLEKPNEAVIDAALQLIHSEPTAALYESWQLPRSLMTMCQNHHRLSLDAPAELHFVRLVSGLDALRLGAGMEKHEALSEIAESAAALKLTDAQLRVANSETHEYGEKVLRMFG
jgi:HD-like signal output (HDOD) protein